MPRFSIIIPAFNAQDTIGSTLAAIWRQGLSDWEAIVVDDGSTDGTRAVVETWTKIDPRVRLAQNPGQGPAQARNFGAATLAKGAVIAFCDADDIWTDGKLASLDHALKDDALDAVFGQIAFFTKTPEDARTTSQVPAKPLDVPALLGENPVCTMSNLAIRREVFVQSGGFDVSMVHNEDLEWLIRLVGSGARVQGIEALHVFYRTSPSGLSADLAAMQAGRRQALRTAACFGFAPDAAAEAAHLRYLARRALRLDISRFLPLVLTVSGVRASPAGFFSPVYRGAATAMAACLAPVLPRRMRHSLFSR